MIGVLKKIWDFAGEEQDNIRKSMILGFFYAVFHMFQIAAIYVVVLALVGGSTDSAPAWQALGLLLASILGRAVLNRFSQLQQTHAGYFMVADKRISIGDKLKRVPLKQLYDQVAFVSQDNYLFDESIRENIRMGRPAATDAEVEAVAKAAGCDAFIRSLEHGYDTVVGGGGAHLSGGERQRIAIARAMLKDAPIVVLDEATAYIDPENEAVVQQAVGRLVAGKTVLVIAHRLSTITGADQIVVVNGGRIQDVGTHGELLKNCPLYQEMWRAHMGAKEGEQA